MVNLTYSLFLFISGAVSLAIAGIAWRRRPSAGAAALAVTMIAMVIWAWMYGLYWMAPTRSEKFFWLSLAFIGVVIVTPAFLVMAAQFSGKTEWPTRRIYVLLSILPSLVLLSLWTEPWFDLFSGGVDFLDPKNSMQGGLGFGLSALNANGLTFIAVFYLIRALRGAHRSRREQIVMILVGTSFPFVAGYISLLRLSPFPDLDLTPVVFSLSGVVYAYAMFGYKMMDLAPMGRESVIEKMDYGVLVVDHLDRVIDLNPMATEFFDAGKKNPISRPLTEVLPAWLKLTDLNRKSISDHYHLEVEDDSLRHFDISITPLINKNGEAVGRTFVVRDVSIQKNSEAILREMNTQLEQQLGQINLLHTQLQEQAIRDSLTGLFNRGYLDETLPRELARAERDSSSLCVLMIDIDKFKLLNDTYGHSAGDTVLQKFGELVSRNTRQNDVACRYGGDEFVVLMPNISIDEAIQRGKQLGMLFSKLSFNFENTEVQATLSIGVASFPDHGKTVDGLLIAADKALYSAKEKRSSISKYVPTEHS